MKRTLGILSVVATLAACKWTRRVALSDDEPGSFMPRCPFSPMPSKVRSKPAPMAAS